MLKCQCSELASPPIAAEQANESVQLKGKAGRVLLNTLIRAQESDLYLRLSQSYLSSLHALRVLVVVGDMKTLTSCKEPFKERALMPRKRPVLL